LLQSCINSAITQKGFFKKHYFSEYSLVLILDSDTRGLKTAVSRLEKANAATQPEAAKLSALSSEFSFCRGWGLCYPVIEQLLATTLVNGAPCLGSGANDKCLGFANGKRRSSQ